jgi:hypothetical protein
MATVSENLTAVFDNSHHAATFLKKMRRALELGPKYYLWDLPRYFSHRRQHKLSPWDMAAMVNPFREFGVSGGTEEPVPNYGQALRSLSKVGIQLTIPKRRLDCLLQLWWRCRTVPGEVMECGAYKGATSLLIALLGKLNNLRQTVFILDTFAGMPRVSSCDLGRKEGEFHPVDDQVQILKEQAAALGLTDRIQIHQGLFTDTFAALADRPLKLAFVHIDANIYEGTRDACEYTIPRMNTGGVVVFDDYNGVCDLGARLAIDEHFASRGLRPKPLAASSAWMQF